MVFNVTFITISVVSWKSSFLVGVPRENYRSAVSDLQSLLYNVVSSTPWHERDSNSQL